MANVKVVEFKGEIANAYGRELSSYKNANGEALPVSVPYATSYEKLLDAASVREVGEWPSEAACVKLANAKRKGKARAAANAATLESLGVVKPTNENDPQLRLKNMAEIFKANGESEESARKLAATALNLKWADADDDDDTDDDE
jgi:hypothetical protein